MANTVIMVMVVKFYFDTDPQTSFNLVAVCLALRSGMVKFKWKLKTDFKNSEFWSNFLMKMSTAEGGGSQLSNALIFIKK